MKILAIDPGTYHSAWVVWDGISISSKGKLTNESFRSLIESGRFKDCEVVAMEMVGHYGRGMPAGQEVFDTCVWIGRILELMGGKLEEGGIVDLVARQRVKLHICGTSTAKDANIRQALIDRFGAPGTKKNPNHITYGVTADIWQAFALGVTYVDQESQHRLQQHQPKVAV